MIWLIGLLFCDSTYALDAKLAYCKNLLYQFLTHFWKDSIQFLNNNWRKKKSFSKFCTKDTFQHSLFEEIEPNEALFC